MPSQNLDTVNDSNLQAVANLTIKEVGEDSLGFVSAEYTESINGLLPRLVARFVCDSDKIPTDLSDVNLDLRIFNNRWELKANVDDMKFEINTLTLYMTLAPKDFYYISKSKKYNSIDSAIKEIYFNDSIVNQDLLDNNLIELNQVATTDLWYSTLLLSCLKPPSVFAFNLNELTLTDLNSNNNFKKVNPEVNTYYIEDRQKRYVLDDLLESYPDYSTVDYINNLPSSEILEWGGIKTTYSDQNSDLIKNLVDNTIKLKSLKFRLRVTSQQDLNIQSGDIVEIPLPNVDSKKFLVEDKLVVIGSEVKFNYGLKSLDE